MSSCWHSPLLNMIVIGLLLHSVLVSMLLAVGYFSGTGVFQGQGTCTGTTTSFISDSRTDATAAGFPSAITLEHPSSNPGPDTSAASS